MNTACTKSQLHVLYQKSTSRFPQRRHCMASVTRSKRFCCRYVYVTNIRHHGIANPVSIRSSSFCGAFALFFSLFLSSLVDKRARSALRMHVCTSVRTLETLAPFSRAVGAGACPVSRGRRPFSARSSSPPDHRGRGFAPAVVHATRAGNRPRDENTPVGPTCHCPAAEVNPASVMGTRRKEAERAADRRR